MIKKYKIKNKFELIELIKKDLNKSKIENILNDLDYLNTFKEDYLNTFKEDYLSIFNMSKYKEIYCLNLNEFIIYLLYNNLKY